MEMLESWNYKTLLSHPIQEKRCALLWSRLKLPPDFKRIFWSASTVRPSTLQKPSSTLLLTDMAVVSGKGDWNGREKDNLRIGKDSSEIIQRNRSFTLLLREKPTLKTILKTKVKGKIFWPWSSAFLSRHLICL